MNMIFTFDQHKTGYYHSDLGIATGSIDKLTIEIGGKPIKAGLKLKQSNWIVIIWIQPGVAFLGAVAPDIAISVSASQ